MARRYRKEKKFDIQKYNLFANLKDETVHTVCAVISFAVFLFLLLSAFGLAGRAGLSVFSFLSWLLGVGYYLLPALALGLSVSFIISEERSLALTQTVGSFLFVISGLGIIEISSTGSGGILGRVVSRPLIAMFDVYLSLIIMVALLLVSLLVIFDMAIKAQTLLFWRKFFGKKEEKPSESLTADEEERIALPEEDEQKPEPKPEPKKQKRVEAEEGADFIMKTGSLLGKAYTPPPLSLLENDSGKPGVGDIKANANIIKRTLLNFGIVVEMDEISIGPSVTRYALKPAEGVKLSRIVGLQNDLSLALAAHPLRIEAPIPGKSLVGIEIPNMTKTTVGLGTLLASPDFQNLEKPLLVSLGKGISGKSHFGNIAKMPHLLIAGATGSGKSVTIHALITSLLYRNSPEHLKFIMIDPKRVELTLYNKIPHLLTPVITDAKKAILALKWAAREMDRRYDILEENSARDIESYHKNVLAPAIKKLEGVKDKEGVDMPDTMPYIVVVIDELADIMTSYPRELEAAIVRLAQMSRAVGIHLVLSTQRPSVNVITGLIKANIPARVALQVASQIDSRTILDMSGAEKLLGAGDMLYLGGEMSKPERIQSAFISEKEVKSVVKYLADNYRDELPTDIDFTTAGASAGEGAIFDSEVGDDDDDLYEDARETVVEAGKASTSFLQRKLRVGYARAARLMDMLEERGVIGPGEGAKPRDVLVKSDRALGGPVSEAGFEEESGESDIEDVGVDETYNAEEKQ